MGGANQRTRSDPPGQRKSITIPHGAQDWNAEIVNTAGIRVASGRGTVIENNSRFRLNEYCRP